MQLAGKLGRCGVVSAIRPGRLFFVTDSSSHRRFLVNTGSAFSIMPWRSSSPPSGPGLTGADGRCIPCWGEQPFTVTIGGVPRQWTFLLAAVSFPILGIDFLHHHSLVVDVANQRLSSPPAWVGAVVPGQSYAEAVHSPPVATPPPAAAGPSPPSARFSNRMAAGSATVWLLVQQPYGCWFSNRTAAAPMDEETERSLILSLVH